jgi:hypothetical protein
VIASFIYLVGIIGGVVLGALIQRSIDEDKIMRAYRQGENKGWNDRDSICLHEGDIWVHVEGEIKRKTPLKYGNAPDVVI